MNKSVRLFRSLLQNSMLAYIFPVYQELAIHLLIASFLIPKVFTMLFSQQQCNRKKLVTYQNSQPLPTELPNSCLKDHLLASAPQTQILTAGCL